MMFGEFKQAFLLCCLNYMQMLVGRNQFLSSFNQFHWMLCLWHHCYYYVSDKFGNSHFTAIVTF